MCKYEKEIKTILVFNFYQIFKNKILFYVEKLVLKHKRVTFLMDDLTNFIVSEMII